MRTPLVAAALVTGLLMTATTPTAIAQQVGQPVPELTAVKWYNAPPLRFEDLRGKTVMIEVFRTW